MKELLMLVATITPEEVILEQLEEAIRNHKLVGTDDTKNNVLMHCQMLIVNHMTKGSPEKMSEILKNMDKQEERNKLFDVNNLS